ncbi:MAG: glycosyltransferase [Anaerolineae bacterium]|nr:glycosyltransferase [Anaerolineae bacterium]
MKVLLAVHGFPPTHFAGAERAAERIALWLVAQGHQVEVFTLENLSDPNAHLTRSEERGFVVHRLHYDLKAGDHFQNRYDDPRVGAAFQDVLKQNRFDVVHVVSGYLLGGQVIHTAKAAGIPVALTLTEYWFMCERLNLLHRDNQMCVGPDSHDKCARCVVADLRRHQIVEDYAPRLSGLYWGVLQGMGWMQDWQTAFARRRETLKAALEAVDVVISPSRFLIEKFTEYEYDLRQAAHIPHGLKPPAASIQRASASNGTRLRIGYLGQIKSHKGVDLLIDAALPMLADGASIAVDLWGSSQGGEAYGEALQARTRDVAAIHWRGSFKGAQVWEALSSIDVLVVPSRWYENSPIVILEAFTAGIPVIATRLGGMKEKIQHEQDGLLFEKDDIVDLRRQLQRLLDEPDLLARLRQGIPPVPTVDDELGMIYAQYRALVGHD